MDPDGWCVTWHDKDKEQMERGDLKTRRAGSKPGQKEERQIVVTRLWNRVTSRQSVDPGNNPGSSDPGRWTVCSLPY